MSYLQRLASRAIGGTLEVRPRGRSRFESARAPDEPTLPTLNADAEAAFTHRGDAPADGTLATGSSRPAGQAARMARGRAGEVAVRPDVPARPGLAAGDAHPAMSAALPPASPDPATLRSPLPPSFAARADTAAPRAALSPAFEPPLAPGRTLAAVQGGAPPAASALSGKSASDAETKGSGGARHVHVTIGRIEVRALAPAAPHASAPRRPQVALSLEDYLRKRGEP